MDKKAQHNSEIVKQFSKQAIPFTKLPGHMDATQLLISFSKVDATDNVIDVACGPGLVVCEFAKHCKEITGIDITPEMIKLAKDRQRGKGIRNILWNIGDAYPLPYADNTFSLVITRYSFHHFLNPGEALKEIVSFPIE
ncbi:class I SAM-dependent methyltransferase [Deferribacteres bacterium DY0037]|uniref:class I SAM-dependent methyltransferase n=1 Tax=Denitrovibrio acetiphilus TaxID=118000 RepID=UPI0003067859|nr:class I SAM-dependent methyltransferase [Denitrovibrio acetiphilus]